MKSKITKIQVLMKGIAIIMTTMFLASPMAYAVTSLDDSYLDSSFWEQILYGEIGSTAKQIEEWFASGQTTLYIMNETQLRALAEYVNNGNSCSGKKIILLNDIEVDSTKEWIPIGNENSLFRGTFDGKGYTISGINFNRGDKLYSEITNVGLFGYIYNAEIKNVDIVNSKFDIPYNLSNDILSINSDFTDEEDVKYGFLGAIAGRSGYSSIINCNVDETVSITGLTYVGGIVGYSVACDIIECSNKGFVNGFSYVGGIAGGFTANINEIPSNNVNYADSSYKVGRAISCINEGEIYALFANVGGIVGAMSRDTILQKCENIGTVAGSVEEFEIKVNGTTLTEYDYSENIGGIVGCITGNYENKIGYSTVDACINRGEVRGYYDVGGIAGQLGALNGGRTIFTNNINYSMNVESELSTTEAGYLAGDVGGSGNISVLDDNAYVYMANNLYRGYSSYNNDYSNNNESTSSTALGFGQLHEYSVTNINDDPTSKSYNYYYETNNIEPIVEDMPNLSDDEKAKLYKNSASMFYYDSEKEEYFITLHEDAEREIRMSNQSTLDSFNLKLVATENTNGPTIQLGETISERRHEDEPLHSYSTATTIKFSNEDAFVIDENTGLWTIKQENKLWDNDKTYIINDSTGATVKYIIEKQEHIEDNRYNNASAINGKTYYKEQDKIIIKAIFEGITSWNGVSKILSLKKADGETIDLGEGSTSGYQITYTYTVQPGEEFEIVELVQGSTITVPVDVIFADAKVPTVKSKVYVENELETERYTAGKEVIIEITTSEELDDLYTEVPVVQVEFTKSGIGKYNYLREEGKAGFAKCEEGKINLDGTTTWIYSYQIQEGDEGHLNVKYTSGKVGDFAGNVNSLEEQDIAENDWGAEDLNVTYKLYKNSVSAQNEIKGKTKLNKSDKLYVEIEYDKVLYTMIGNVNEEEANEKFEDRYKDFIPSIYLNGNSKLKGSVESVNVNAGKTTTVYKYDFNDYELNSTLNLQKILLKNENNERFIALGSFREGSIVYSEEYYETYISDANADAAGVEHQEYGFIEKDKTKELEIDLSIIINSEEGGYIYADTTAPTVKITPTIANGEDLYTIPFDTTNANEITYIFEFSEYVTGFTAEDISVNGGLKDEFEELVEGLQYKLTVKPTTTVQKEGTLQVIVEKGACLDQVAKENVRQEKIITIDKIKPTLQDYEIYQDGDKIIADFIFSEAIKEGHIQVEILGSNEEDSNEEIAEENLEATIDDNEPNKVRCVYTKDAEVGGKVTVSYEIEVNDIAGNNSGLITIEPEEEFMLEQTIIKPSKDEDTFYTFKKGDADINSFAEPTYFKAGEEITVEKHTSSTEVTVYRYKVEGTLNLTQMRYMTLTEPTGRETEGTVSFSNTTGSVDITDAKIYFDTVAPTVTLSANVEDKNQTGVYSEGEEIIITATTNEPVKEPEKNVPEIKVSFTNSGLGKFNYQTESGKGNAIHFNTITNDNGAITWEYYYEVESGDDGTAIIEYAKVGKVTDLAGNETTFKLYPDVNRGNTNLVDNVIAGTETKVSFEIFKNTEKITDFTRNTYFAAGDKIKVIAKYNKVLYSKYEQLQKIPVEERTAPKLVIDGKEFTVESVNNDLTRYETTITYVYNVTSADTEKLLEKLTITRTGNSLKAIHEELQNKVVAGETVQEKVIVEENIPATIINNKDIKNCNLHIYNNSTLVSGGAINVDTIEPKVAIKAEREVTIEGVTTKEEIENATNSNKILYTIEFSEQVTNFDKDASITVNGGTKGTLQEVEVGRKYTLEVIPSVADGNVGNVQVIIEKDACKDKVGQGNVRLEKIISVDKKAPILLGIEAYAQSNSNIKLNEEIDIVKEYYKTGDVVTIVAIFDENVSTNAKLLVQFSESGNAKGTVTQTVREGNRITYTYTITNGDKGSLAVKTFTGEATDAAGNEIIVTKRALDGDTIIADTIRPELKELKVVTPATNGSYKAGTQIKIEAIYDEEIYVLEDNEIKLVKTDIEIVNEDGTKSYVNNAPTLKIKFGSGKAKEATLSGYSTKVDGTEDRTKLLYTYEIVEEHEEIKQVNGKEVKETIPGDNGLLTVVSYMNKNNVQVCDIAGNTAELDDINQTGSVIKADTEGPEVARVTAEVKNPLVKGTGKYHKAGNEIEIVVKYNEEIHQKLSDTIKVKFGEANSYKDATIKEWTKDTDTIKYTYTIQPGDNGELQVKVPQSVCTDIAGNRNEESRLFTVDEVYADTTDPYLATNTNGVSQLEINWIENNDKIVTGVEVIAIFSEEVYSMDDNSIIGLSNIPTVGIFANGELKDEIPYKSKALENGKTKIKYRKDSITSIDTNGTVSANFIDGKVFDRAGNEMSIESNGGDMASPIFKDIKVVTPIGFYKAGEEIEILARFNEQTKLTSTLPTLKIRVGEKVVTLRGQYDPENVENTDTIKVAKYTYEIEDDDNGALNIISLIGSASDGVRTNNKISQIYIDLTDDQKDDVNGNRNELLDSKGLRYSNNSQEYKNVYADTIKPYITSVEVIANTETIASYTKDEGKDPVATTNKTNVNELEYIITFSELVRITDESKIQLYNGAKLQITNNADEEEDYYNQITVKVATTIEGVQSLIVLDDAIEDRAGNGISLERFNLVTTDFTKPTVRFISEYNGGVYVLPTSIGKVEIRTNVEINEDISKIEYKWDNNEKEDYAKIEQYASTSDIVVPTKEFTTEGRHTLYIRVTDLAGNVTIASKEYSVSASKIKITAENENLPEDAEYKLAPTNGDVIVKVDFGTGLTDNRRVVFKAEGSNEYKEKVPNEDGTYTITENGFVYAEATDKVGNRVVAEEEIDNIDKEVPTVELTLNGADLILEDGRVGAKVNTIIKTSEPTKIKYMWSGISSGGEVTTNWSETREYTTVEEVECGTNVGEMYLSVIVTDEAGNERDLKSNAFRVFKLKDIEEEKSEDEDLEGEDSDVVDGEQLAPLPDQNVPEDIEISKLIAFKQEGKFISIKYNNFTEGEEYLDIIKDSEISLTNERDGDIDYEHKSYVVVNGATTITVVGTDACGNQVTATYEVTKESIEGPEFEVVGNPEYWTNQDVKLEVSCYEELSALTVNGTNILSQDDKVRSYIIVTENGDYEFIATDTYGNVSKKTIKVSKIDKVIPEILEVTVANNSITITATDIINEVEGSGIAEYAITNTTELPVEWSESNVIKTTKDGAFYVWVKDNAGNIIRTEDMFIVDTTAPIITFNYLSQTVTVGMPLEANITTDENAIITYSWDKENWVNSEELISSLTVSEKSTTIGKATLYVKAKDGAGNESKVHSLEFNITNIEEIRQPEIIFEDIPTIQINGIKYIKVNSNTTTQGLTNKMNQEALCGKTPEYTKLTEENNLKTGSEIVLNNDVKYIVVVNGDINCDGKVTFADIIKTNAVRMSSSEENITKAQLLAADINNTNKIEFKDIISINAIRINSSN